MIASHELVSVLSPFHLREQVWFFLRTFHVLQVCVLVNIYAKERLEQLQVSIASVANSIASSF